MYMKTHFTRYLLMLSLPLFLAFTNNHPTPQLSKVDLVGTWSLEKSKVVANYLGFEVDDTDRRPSGTIVFNANGSGAGYFTTELLGISYGSFGDFTWNLKKDKIRVKESSGKIREWLIISFEEDQLKLSWEDSIKKGTAAFTFTLSK